MPQAREKPKWADGKGNIYRVIGRKNYDPKVAREYIYIVEMTEPNRNIKYLPEPNLIHALNMEIAEDQFGLWAKEHGVEPLQTSLF